MKFDKMKARGGRKRGRKKGERKGEKRREKERKKGVSRERKGERWNGSRRSGEDGEEEEKERRERGGRELLYNTTMISIYYQYFSMSYKTFIFISIFF